MRRKWSGRREGFTLIELIMVIVIAGIIAAMVAVFIKAPVEGYFNSVRRAVLTEEADSALRVIARDLQSALPNSITCNGATYPLEFLSIRSGGRFREAQTGASTGTPLVFGSAATGFDTIGGAADVTQTDAGGGAVSGTSSRVVVGNLSTGVPTCHSTVAADGAASFVANGPVMSSLATGSATVASAVYPVECNLASAAAQDDSSTSGINESNDREFGRFYVVNSTSVKYTCSTTSGVTRSGVKLVDPSHVSACQIACDQTKARVQLVTVNLTLRDSASETVTLLRRVTIVNRP
ncbi:type II secretion system protein [Propionivibrio dicarboxylicus]|uniref:MSHA biogenesis protein MshO n=1 Tax=Propionivibrio dicarboxylicus TaxID=83767 RepID=A0A1G8IJC2_9RHOO|nr:type II secretion system protein [Propionivibrio dicarboxylicus]SDI19046.1 MSHA biogenesis protein MshO [Propionivibrio dicarboxylicus]